MALTTNFGNIQQLYQQYAGREADPGGMAYWGQQFGSEIDPSEVAAFANAIAEARAQGRETALPTPPPAPVAAPAPVTAPAPAPVTIPEVKDHRGKSYDTQQLLSLAQQLAPTLDPENLQGGVYGVERGNIGFAFEDAEKVLGYAPSAAEQVVLDMARHLMDEGVTDLSQIEAKDQNRRFGATYTGEGGTIYEIQKDPVTGEVRTQTWGKSTSDKGNIIAALSIGAGLLGVPLSLGSALAPTLSTAAQGAIGGALLGGGTAALSGGNVLQGSLLGGLGGYVQGANAVPAQDSIYSLANGTPNIDYMGGGQGLTSTGASNLASMGGAQGLQILGGLPSSTLAEALSSFGGVNPSALADMGIGTGITYVTPTGIVTENGTIIGGDVISEFGKNTGFDLTNWLNENIGTSIGDELATIDTGISSGITAPTTAPVTTPTTTPSTEGTTIGKVLDAVKLGGAVTSLIGAGTGAGETGFGIVPVPSDWTTPTYGQPIGTVQGLPPIDFGSPELLRGTQWEKYLNPMQPAIAPAPQTGMGYNQLMNTLQGGQGGSLSLNDIISGIQGQYGQTPTGTAS